MGNSLGSLFIDCEILKWQPFLIFVLKISTFGVPDWLYHFLNMSRFTLLPKDRDFRKSSHVTAWPSYSVK